MLFATSDSAVAKKPRLRLSMRRSSSVRPSGILPQRDVGLHGDLGGIQWLAQAARYFSQAHLYLNGSSWLTSARAVDHAPCRRPIRGLRRARSASLGRLGWTALAPSRWAHVRRMQAWWLVQTSRASLHLRVLIVTGRLRSRDRRWSRPSDRRPLHMPPAARQHAASPSTALSLPSVPFSVDFSTWVARLRAQVVGRLQAAQPGQPVESRRASCPTAPAM